MRGRATPPRSASATCSTVLLMYCSSRVRCLPPPSILPRRTRRAAPSPGAEPGARGQRGHQGAGTGRVSGRRAPPRRPCASRPGAPETAPSSCSTWSTASVDEQVQAADDGAPRAAQAVASAIGPGSSRASKRVPGWSGTARGQGVGGARRGGGDDERRGEGSAARDRRRCERRRRGAPPSRDLGGARLAADVRGDLTVQMRESAASAEERGGARARTTAARPAAPHARAGRRPCPGCRCCRPGGGRRPGDDRVDRLHRAPRWGSISSSSGITARLSGIVRESPAQAASSCTKKPASARLVDLEPVVRPVAQAEFPVRGEVQHRGQRVGDRRAEDGRPCALPRWLDGH